LIAANELLGQEDFMFHARGQLDELPSRFQGVVTAIQLVLHLDEQTPCRVVLPTRLLLNDEGHQRQRFRGITHLKMTSRETVAHRRMLRFTLVGLQQGRHRLLESTQFHEPLPQSNLVGEGRRLPDSKFKLGERRLPFPRRPFPRHRRTFHDEEINPRPRHGHEQHDPIPEKLGAAAVGVDQHPDRERRLCEEQDRIVVEEFLEVIHGWR